MDDLISRQEAIDAMNEVYCHIEMIKKRPVNKTEQAIYLDMIGAVKSVPSAQTDLDEFCFTCKEYDQERHCCPRFNRVIRETLKEAQPEPRWIPVEIEPPKERRSYWVCTDTGYQCECRWTNNIYGLWNGLWESDQWGWSIFDIPQYSKVIAYMPLPEPYKRSEDAEQR